MGEKIYLGVENEKYVDYKDMYVAFLDILGFKDIIHNVSCAEIYDIFQQVEETRLLSPITWIDKEKNEPLDKVKKYIMSDSIVMYIEAKRINALSALIKQCAIMGTVLLKRQHPILLRGGISRGEFYRKQSIAFGPGLVSAYNLENTTKMPRIHVDPVVKNEINKKIVEENFLYEEEGEWYVDYISKISAENLKDILNRIEHENNSVENVRKKYEYIMERIRVKSDYLHVD